MEKLDVYSLNREKTGKVLSRENVFGELAEDERILLVHACVFDSDGRMLIQQRQITKDRYPGCWDVSAGGFVSAGEESTQAVSRELSEELGLSVPESSFVFTCCEPFGKVLDDFYSIFIDLDISALRLQETEVMRADWADRKTVLQFIRDGQFVDYSEDLINRLFDKAESR